MRTNITAGIALRHCGFLHARSLPRPQMSVSRRHRMFSYLLAFNRLPPVTQMGRSLVAAGSTALCGSTLTRLPRLTVKTTVTGVTPGVPISHALQAGTPLSFLTCTMTVSQPPEFLDQSPRRCPGPALKSDQRCRRPTDKLQILSWNPVPARGSDPSLLASHLNGPWHVICVQGESGFVTDSSLAENFHVITQHHCAVLLNKDTFTRDFSCTPIRVPCSLRQSTWAVEGMVVTGKFRTAPDQSCSHFTVANVHINNECARRRSVCIALLLLICDLCMKLGAVILTGDFNKDVESETPSGDGERRTSPLEAAFSQANIPWPTFGVTPLWGPGELNGRKWPHCCGFLVLPESQTQWLILRHASLNVVPAAIGMSATDQTWHYEHCLHLKCAGRQRRRDISTADSKSRQKIVLHTNM